ncbi:MAG: hypothetical protein JNM17_38885 [Archangium sp.]|nr:hypothetical protein [Archangium sp.]
MTVTLLRTLNSLLTRDDERLDGNEAKRLVDSSRDGADVTADEKRELRAIALAPKTTLEARSVIEAFVSEPVTEPVLRAMTGFDASSFDDDVVVLGRDGALRGTSGITPYSRGYDAVHTGPMRLAHGSKAPHSALLTDEENARLSELKPADALDAAAKERGAQLGGGFSALAAAKSSYDPQAPTWWGKCHAWAWSAMSTELAARVDVGGPEGQRGLWLGGQWVSRADLGNFLMGTADHISLADPNTLMDSKVSAYDLLAATSQFLVNGGGGFVADIHNDEVHGGEREVWNQPFVSADVDTTTLTGEVADALLRLARADGVEGGVMVKHVHVIGRYGNERGDAWEGEAHLNSRAWNVYAVTDANGVVQGAYMADDPKLASFSGLPTLQSQELPEYVWKPTMRAVDSALTGRLDRSIDEDSLGREFRFLVGDVLKNGVPGAVRSRFEAEVASLPQGPIDASRLESLKLRYPGIDAAYSKAQWERLFKSRGL